jgi:hypothetical protein
MSDARQISEAEALPLRQVREAMGQTPPLQPSQTEEGEETLTTYEPPTTEPAPELEPNPDQTEIPSTPDTPDTEEEEGDEDERRDQ